MATAKCLRPPRGEDEGHFGFTLAVYAPHHDVSTTTRVRPSLVPGTSSEAPQSQYLRFFSRAICVAGSLRPYPWSVMYTSPANRSRSPFTVGIYNTAGRGLSLWVSLEAWSAFYGVSLERVESIFGHEQQTDDVTTTLAEEFAAKLDRLFDATETQGTD